MKFALYLHLATQAHTTILVPLLRSNKLMHRVQRVPWLKRYARFSYYIQTALNAWELRVREKE